MWAALTPGEHGPARRRACGSPCSLSVSAEAAQEVAEGIQERTASTQEEGPSEEETRTRKCSKERPAQVHGRVAARTDSARGMAVGDCPTDESKIRGMPRANDAMRGLPQTAQGACAATRFLPD